MSDIMVDADVSDDMSDAPLVPRPGWTQEQEYRALSEEFFKVEDSRDRLAAEVKRLREGNRKTLYILDEAMMDPASIDWPDDAHTVIARAAQTLSDITALPPGDDR